MQKSKLQSNVPARTIPFLKRGESRVGGGSLHVYLYEHKELCR